MFGAKYCGEGRFVPDKDIDWSFMSCGVFCQGGDDSDNACQCELMMIAQLHVLGGLFQHFVGCDADDAVQPPLVPNVCGVGRLVL